MSFLWNTGSAIPDSGLLQARYDATEVSLSDGETVTTWADETGNGHDLTADGGPTFRTDSINGNATVEYDGTDDRSTVTWSTLTQPHYIFVVASKQSQTSNADYIIGGNSSSTRHGIGSTDGSDWQVHGGTNVTDGATDTDNHIFAGIFDGANSELRLDGTSILSDDFGSNDSDGLQVGNTINAGVYADVHVGEILFYSDQPTVSNVESYLSNRWGITV